MSPSSSSNVIQGFSPFRFHAGPDKKMKTTEQILEHAEADYIQVTSLFDAQPVANS